MALFNIDKQELLKWWRQSNKKIGWYVRNNSALTNHINHTTINIYPTNEGNASWLFVSGRYMDFKVLVCQYDDDYGYMNDFYINELAKPRTFKDAEDEWNWLKHAI